ncbi:MAG: hypothetical protein D6735_13085 [Acidobacteria bacterium]|nr:MAG: hypothetical protein D6735_13085 [Acidobacteriota bacterium]
MGGIGNFLLFGLAWIVGMVIGALFLGQCLIIIRFGIPTAVRLANAGVMSSYAPVRNYAISFILLSVLLAAFTVAVFLFFPTYKFPYLFGLAITFLLANNAAGFNPNNLADFLQFNARYLPEDLKGEDIAYLCDPKTQSLSSMAGSEVFARVFGESVSNIIFYGIVVFVIFIVGKFSWWIGVILFGAYTLLFVVLFLQFIFAAGSVIIILIVNVYKSLRGEKGNWKDALFMLSASLVQGIERAVYALCVFNLYQIFFQGA